MTVKELRELLKNVKDDAPVFVMDEEGHVEANPIVDTSRGEVSIEFQPYVELD